MAIRRGTRTESELGTLLLESLRDSRNGCFRLILILNQQLFLEKPFPKINSDNLKKGSLGDKIELEKPTPIPSEIQAHKFAPNVRLKNLENADLMKEKKES